MATPVEEGGDGGAQEEAEVPEAAPPDVVSFRAEFHGDCSEDEGEQEEHEGDVEAGEDGGVGVGEGGEHGTAKGDEPDLVAVPKGADGVHEEASFRIGLGQGVEHADAEIEAVENGVAGKEDSQQGKPDQAKHIVGHGPYSLMYWIAIGI